ncbi:MAG: AAA family ATPase [Candidatus Dormibacteria bacterium]
MTEGRQSEPPPPPPPAGALVGGSPWQRTRMELPKRRSAPQRLVLAARAMVRSRPLEDVYLAPDPRGGPSPGELTVAHGSGPIGRPRAAWRETDYVGGLERRIAEPRLTHCATVAVVSPKGGVGKTTVTALLGMLFAELRHDRIVAIDTNPDYGSLGRTLAPSHRVYVDDLLAVLDDPTLTITQLDASLARAHHGLLVLPAPTAPERMAKLDRYGYSRVIQRLQRLVSVILLDCGTGLWEPAAQVALAAATQVVLISDAEPATASLVAEASQQLRTLDVPVTLVVNKANRGGRLDIERFAQNIRWAHGLVTIADEPRAAASIGTGDFEWHHAPKQWRIALRELGALITGDWDCLGLTL